MTAPVEILGPSYRPSASEQAYRDSVDRLYERMLEHGEAGRISNGKPEHAVYLIHKLLSNAKETVLLFCTNLALTDTSYLAYGSAYVIDVARNFLRNPGAELSIIVREDVDGGADNHPLIQAVRNEKGNGWMMGRFEVRRLQDGAASDEPDFILVD